VSRQARHRPQRSFVNAEWVIVECELERCVHCRQPLVPGRTWRMRKHVQTMAGPLFVAGKSKPVCVYAQAGDVTILRALTLVSTTMPVG
jgi:hypothetical protein